MRIESYVTTINSVGATTEEIRKWKQKLLNLS